MKKILKIVFYFVLAGFAVVLFNGFDQPLNHEIEDYQKKASVVVDPNGFHHWLGFDAPQGEEPVDIAINSLKSHRAGDSSRPRRARPAIKGDSVLLNKLSQDGCLETFDCLADPIGRIEISRLVGDNQFWLKRYEKLIAHTTYQEPFIAGAVFSYPDLKKVQQLFLLKLALDDRKKGDLLRQDIRFWRSVLESKTTTVQSQLAAAARLKADYHYLATFLLRHPEQRSIYKEELAPLSKSQATFGYSLFNSYLSGSLQFAEICDRDGVEAGKVYLRLAVKNSSRKAAFSVRLSRKIENYFYKKNATLNQLYKSIVQWRDAALENIDAMKRADQDIIKANELSFLRWDMVYNPVGKTLISLGLPSGVTEHQPVMDELETLIDGVSRR